MATNKVEVNTGNGVETLIDLTADSVTPETLAEGETAHGANGALIVGTAKKVNIVQGKGTSTTDVMSQAAASAELNKLSEEIADQQNVSESLTARVKNLEDSEGGATNEQIAQIEANKNDIAELEENKANVTDVKAWILQRTPRCADGSTVDGVIEWLRENGDTNEVYIADGNVSKRIFAYLYKESTKPPYTNLIPLSKEADRITPFNNGQGYIDAHRLNSSGAQASCAGMQTTGFMPITYGAIIRLKGIKNTTSAYGQNMCFYNSANTLLGTTGSSKDFGNTAGIKGWEIVKEADGTFTCTIDTTKTVCATDITGCDSFRFSCGDFSNAIITVNEEIVGGGSSGGYDWYETGHTFPTPAEYEDRIVELEQAIEEGNIGGKLTITNIVESTEDGGSNIVTFSDGNTLTTKNGRTGSKGKDGANGKNGTVQIDPLFAKTIEELRANGDPSKMYILSTNNLVYENVDGQWRWTGNSFISTDASCQKYLSDRNTYIAPVPSGYCESKNEYQDTGVQIANAVNYEMMNNNFRALASAYPDYITETLLGKDASNTYDIYKYELDLNPAISDGYTSVMSTNKPVFIITSGLHGNEKDPVHEVYHFMKDLCENFMESEHLEYLRTNVKFVIVPIANPWGFVNHTYNNSNDVNLNKNFGHGFSQVTGGAGSSQNTGAAAYSEAETVLLKGVFDEYKDAVFHLECHGKVAVDTAWNQVIWFSLMKSLASELIELCSNTIIHQIGRRLYKLGFDTGKSEGGYITYYPLNGRPKDYTATEYGMLSCTMEGTGRMGVAGHTSYTKHEQRINCEALENFILRVLDSLNSRVVI